ncbi:MAG: lamin tail domain-containing protein [Promethearchaeota archaeon]
MIKLSKKNSTIKESLQVILLGSLLLCPILFTVYFTFTDNEITVQENYHKKFKLEDGWTLIVEVIKYPNVLYEEKTNYVPPPQKINSTQISNNSDSNTIPLSLVYSSWTDNKSHNPISEYCNIEINCPRYEIFQIRAYNTELQLILSIILHSYYEKHTLNTEFNLADLGMNSFDYVYLKIYLENNAKKDANTENLLKVRLQSEDEYYKLQSDQKSHPTEGKQGDSLSRYASRAPRTQEPYSIYGTVRFPNSSVVPGATVQVINRDDGDANDTTTTDDGGHYVIDLASFSEYNNSDEILVRVQLNNQWSGGNLSYVDATGPGSFINVTVWWLQIDEIYYYSTVFLRKDQYIVIYNPSTLTQNITGLVVSDGIGFARFPNYTLNGESYTIIAKTTTAYNDTFPNNYPDFDWNQATTGADNLINCETESNATSKLDFNPSGDVIFLSDSYPPVISLDVVVWGSYSESNIPERFFDGIAAPSTTSGKTIGRVDIGYEGEESWETKENLSATFHEFSRATNEPPPGGFYPEFTRQYPYTFPLGILFATTLVIIISKQKKTNIRRI